MTENICIITLAILMKRGPKPKKINQDLLEKIELMYINQLDLWKFVRRRLFLNYTNTLF